MRQFGVFIIGLMLLGPSLEAQDQEEVTFSSADGVTLGGTFYAPDEEGASAVILLHDLGRDRSDWKDLAEELQGEDYAVLAFDLRGHGQSTQKGGGTVSYKSMSDADFGNAVQDLQAAYQYLAGRKEVDRNQVVLVGAGLGANLGLKFATRERRVKALTLLSPGLAIKGLMALEDMDRYGQRPVLLVASLKDIVAADAVRQLEKAARGERMVKVYEDAGHGAEMLKKEDDLIDLVVDWLDDTL